jgi:hypothetical protein
LYKGNELGKLGNNIPSARNRCRVKLINSYELKFANGTTYGEDINADGNFSPICLLKKKHVITKGKHITEELCDWRLSSTVL